MRIIHKAGNAARRGSVMIPALLVVFAVAVLSMIQLQLDLARAREMRGSTHAKRAFYMAEAGLAESFLGLVSGKSGNVGSPEEPALFADGLFFVTAREEGLGRVTLTSTGLCGAGRATLSMVLERRSESPAALGFYAAERLVAEQGCTIDSYDSRESVPPSRPLLALPLEAPPTGTRLGCNQDVQIGGLLSDTRIYGDARPGPGGVLTQTRATITGSTAPFTVPAPLPAVTVPSLPRKGSLSTSLLAPTLAVGAGEHAYDELHVKTGGLLTLRGPMRVSVGRLRVENLGELKIDASAGPVEIWVTDWLNLASGSKLGTGGTDPRSVTILVAATGTIDRDGNGTPDAPVTLAAGGKMQGTLYAPNADVSIPSTLSVYGAVTARRLTIKSGAALWFDRSLVETGAGEGTLPRLMGWRIVELPEAAIVKLRYDIMEAMRIEGVVPVPSKDAHLSIGVLPP